MRTMEGIWCKWDRGGQGRRRRDLMDRLKFFMHPDLDDFKRAELIPKFSKVVVEKPKESRKGE